MASNLSPTYIFLLEDSIFFPQNKNKQTKTIKNQTNTNRERNKKVKNLRILSRKCCKEVTHLHGRRNEERFEGGDFHNKHGEIIA